MKTKQVFNKIISLFRRHDVHKDELLAGTGFMICLSDVIRDLQSKGYTENLVPKFNHFGYHNNQKIYPQEFIIDEIIRFENSSDPDDQSILYAISSQRHGLKGIYVESYGVYHDELSNAMLERIKLSHKQQNQAHFNA